MKLTPDIVEHAYELLRHTSPFAGWRLPHADDMGFEVTADFTTFGYFRPSEPPLIRVSLACNGQLSTVLQTLAHEMIHLRQHRLGKPLEHDDFFYAAAKSVCRANGWDVRAFG